MRDYLMFLVRERKKKMRASTGGERERDNETLFFERKQSGTRLSFSSLRPSFCCFPAGRRTGKETKEERSKRGRGVRENVERKKIFFLYRLSLPYFSPRDYFFILFSPFF